MLVRALSLKQPWANLIAQGTKTIETRSWKTNYRGDLLICSSQNPKIEPYGHALCIVELIHVEPMRVEHEKAACIQLFPRAYAWHIQNVRLITPFPVKGQLNIFSLEVPDDSEISLKWKKGSIITQ